MRVLITMDSFKGSLTSVAAGNAVKDGIMELRRNDEVKVFPLADGGEGSVEALSACMGGSIVETTVTGPLSSPVKAKYSIGRDGTTAVIEIAAAAGLTLVPDALRDPMETTSYGVGELIKEAIHRGCRHFIICLGGSATNDGGIGMLSALGFSFLDAHGKTIPHGAKGLALLSTIQTENQLPELKECSFRIACDVANPLCGTYGCSHVFAPQKGASTASVEMMDCWMKNYAQLAATVSETADMDIPGVGAAGGLGFAFLAFLNAKLESGIQIVLEEINLEQHIRQADLIVTGEGRLDGQTVMGKAPIGVAHLAKKYGKKVVAFCGCLGNDAHLCKQHGIDAYFSITPSSATTEEALNPGNAYHNLKHAARHVFQLLHVFSD